jgi:hypothetical protein
VIGRHRFALWGRVILLGLFLIAIVAQFLTAGYALFEGGDFGLHEGIGFSIAHALPLLILITTIVFWRAGTQLWMALAIGILGLVQPVLPEIGGWAAVLHPLNALVLFALSQWLLRHDRRLLNAGALPAASEIPAAR